MSGRQYDLLSECVDIDNELSGHRHELGKMECHVSWLKRRIEKLEARKKELTEQLQAMDRGKKKKET